MSRLARHPALLMWLTAVWVALWGDLTLANVAGGLLAAGALIVLLPTSGDRARAVPTGVRIRPVATARFAAWFLWKLVEANAVVAWEVITPRNRINEGIVAVPLSPRSDGLTTLICNAVSLTPGTLVVDLDREPLVLYVHVLHLRTVEEARDDVQTLARLAAAAFGQPEGAEPPPELGDALPPSSTTRAALDQEER